MGQLLDQYLAASLPALQAIVDEEELPQPSMPPGVEGIAQPEGATTFPMGPEAGPMQGQPLDPGGQPTAPMGAMPPPGAGAAPSFGGGPAPGVTPNVPGAETPFFEQAGSPSPTPTMPPAAGAAPEQDRSGEFEKGPDSFMGMADEQDPEDIANATKAMEDQGINIDEQHAALTGTEEYESKDDPKGDEAGKGDPKKMTRQEKGLILMEFGLSLMAASGSGTGTLGGDIGQAGGAALAGHMGRETQRKKMLLEAEDRKLDRELKQAQITKAGKAKTTIKTVGGKLVVINEDTQEATPILMDGKPVDAENVDKYASEVDRQAFEDVVCKDLTGKELHACKVRALAYSKGGAAKVAFPELEIADQRENVMDILQDPDNKSAKYPVPSAGGKQIRWRDMTEGQRMEVRDTLVEQRTKQPNVTTKAGGGGGIEGLSAADTAKMKPGKIYTLSDGRTAKLVDGVPTIID